MKHVQAAAMAFAFCVTTTVVPACKMGGARKTGSAAITMPYADMTSDDLRSAISGLGWTPGWGSRTRVGDLSDITVEGTKEGDRRTLNVTIEKMPARYLAEWKAETT